MIGAHLLQTRDAVYRFFNGPGDGDHHLVDGHDAVVDADQHARKIGGRKYGDRNGEGEISAQQAEREDQEDQRAGMLRDPVPFCLSGFWRIHAEAPKVGSMGGLLVLVSLRSFRFLDRDLGVVGQSVRAAGNYFVAFSAFHPQLVRRRHCECRASQPSCEPARQIRPASPR